MPIQKILTVIGTRPQLIKKAMVSRAFSKVAGISEVVVDTGQHYDDEMARVFYDELGMNPPDFNLGISSASHAAMTARMMEALEPVLQQQAPDVVLVYGDTNSTVAGALTAAKMNIPVAHVEAGLRSYNREMPEEINRIVTDHISRILFCPTQTAMRQLGTEGLDAESVWVGDVMYDAALHFGKLAQQKSNALDKLNIEPGQYALLTLHRAENTRSPDEFAELIDYVRSTADGKTIIFPMHPRTRAFMDEHGSNLSGINVIPPVGYLDMCQLLQSAAMVLTDSGGLQKEAYFHRTPCITLRAETEWTETIDAGWNRLWRTESYAPRREIDDFGDGNAAGKIVSCLLERFQPHS